MAESPTSVYLGKTLEDLKKMSKGLMGNLLLAKLEGQDVLNKAIDAKDEDGKPLQPIVTAYFVREAELTRDAFVTFLTGGDDESSQLHWTVSDLKASLEIEKFRTSGPLFAAVGTNVEARVLKGAPVQVSTSTGNGATTGGGTALGTGQGAVVEPLDMAKSGARHGASLIATGHAYIGTADIVPGSDTTETKNTNTKVKLYRENIKQDLLK